MESNVTLLSIDNFANLSANIPTDVIPIEVLRYLCESSDQVLNLSWVESFNNVSVQETDLVDADWRTIIRILVIGVLFVFSLVGNVIVVVVVLWSPNLKTSLNFYLLNLAIADLLITCVCLSNHLVRNTYYNYPLNPFMCKIGSFVQASCLLGSVFTLSTLSLERVYAVLCPLRARRDHLPSSVALTVVWGVSIFIAAPLCALNEYRVYQFPNFQELRCTYYHSKGNFRQEDGVCVRNMNTFIHIYHILVTVLMFFVPLLIMFCAYALIVRRLWLLQSLGESPQLATSAHLSAKKKVVRLSCSVLLCFVICWAPLQMTILYALTAKPEVLSSSDFDNTIFWVYMLAYSNSALNPILYTWFSKLFREEFKAMIGIGRRRSGSARYRRSDSLRDASSRGHPLQSTYYFRKGCQNSHQCSSYCGKESIPVRYCSKKDSLNCRLPSSSVLLTTVNLPSQSFIRSPNLSVTIQESKIQNFRTPSETNNIPRRSSLHKLNSYPLNSLRENENPKFNNHKESYFYASADDVNSTKKLAEKPLNFKMEVSSMCSKTVVSSNLTDITAIGPTCDASPAVSLRSLEELRLPGTNYGA